MAEPGKLVSRVVVKGGIEDVWREITKADEPQKAIFNARMHRLGLAPGSPIRMRTPDNRYTRITPKKCRSENWPLEEPATGGRGWAG